jgi:hypothetical protein
VNEIGDVLEQRIDLCDDLVLGKIGCYDHRVTKLCAGHDVTSGTPQICFSNTQPLRKPNSFRKLLNACLLALANGKAAFQLSYDRYDDHFLRFLVGGN